MSIATRCPTCGKNYKLADEQAGLRVRCRDCKDEFEVPRPEVREAVAPRPATLPAPHRGPLSDPDLPVPPSLSQPAPGNRKFLYILAGIAGCLMLLMLACGGAFWMIMVQMRRTAAQVVIITEQQKPQPTPVVVQQEKPREVAKKVELPNSLPEIKLPAAPKDLDDALKKLRAPDQFTRLRAIEYIGKQPVPTDAAKKKAVIDALDALKDDKDEIVKAAAGYVKLLWEFD